MRKPAVLFFRLDRFPRCLSATSAPAPADRPRRRSVRRIRCRARSSRSSTPTGKTTSARRFTEAGRHVPRRTSAPTGCQRRGASLAGFRDRPASTCWQAGLDLGSRLAVAPVREAIVVSATRTEAPRRPARRERHGVRRRGHRAAAEPAARRSAATASPGVTIVRTGGYGSVTSLFVRGGESNYTKVLLDGIPLNEPGGTSTSATSRPRTSSAWRSSAAPSRRCSGRTRWPASIQLFTRAAAPAIGAASDATVEGGTFGTGARFGRRRGRAGRVDYSVGAARVHDRQRGAQQRVREHDAVGIGGRAARRRRDRCASPARAELGKSGTPGADRVRPRRHSTRSSSATTASAA